MSVVARKKLNRLEELRPQNYYNQSEIANKYGAILAEYEVESKLGRSIPFRETIDYVKDYQELTKIALDNQSDLINGITESLEDMGIYEGNIQWHMLYNNIINCFK